MTLPISHYVDKVRWCLEKAGIDFEEEKDIGIFGVFFFGRMVPTLKVPGKRISIQNSSDILRYIYGIQLAENPERVKFLEPTAETVEWEKKIDKMGSDLRRYVYYHVSIYFMDNIRSGSAMTMSGSIRDWLFRTIRMSWRSRCGAWKRMMFLDGKKFSLRQLFLY